MELFISGFLLSLSLCLDLGIVNVAIIKTGIEKGFLPSLHIGLGSTVGDIIYATLSVLGITLILKFLWIKWVLWIGGTLVLVYFCGRMAVHIFKTDEKAKNDITPLNDLQTSKTFFYNGLLLALSSPTAILWFATIGGSVFATQTFHQKFELIYFFGGFTSSSLVWSIMLAYVSFKGGQLMKNNIKRLFSILSAVIFLILAIYVFWDGYQKLIK
jgi:L-lysine exporter family protein LysE/ArgO